MRHYCKRRLLLTKMAENVEKRTMEMKNWQYATELPALQSTILIVFKDGTRHT